MVDVEDEIAALYPEVHATLFPRWISSVAKVTHDPGHYNQHCGICRAASTPRIPTAA